MTRFGFLRPLLTGLAGIVIAAALWEAYKAIGPPAGFSIGNYPLLPRTTDLAMPHIWTMLTRLFEPNNALPGAPPLWLPVLEGAWFSLRIAALGWLLGVALSAALALIMLRFRTARAAMLPWVVLSQTVPLIAIAPLVRRWGAQIQFGDFSWENWMSVAVIATYLAFFPVTVGTLRGLTSPDQNHLDLMRAFGAGWWRTFFALRLPASVPFVLPALRLAAASAVIGTVVAEVSIGLRGGIGRLIVEFASATGGDPGKPWAPIFGAVAVGLIAAGTVAVIARLMNRFRRGEDSP